MIQVSNTYGHRLSRALEESLQRRTLRAAGGGGAGSYRTSAQVRAIFKNGQLNTLYPLLSK